MENSYWFIAAIGRYFNNGNMNIEDYREYYLSLGEDMEEKLPFTAFRYASGVLVFYVHGHMFSFFDCDNFSVITLKCQPEPVLSRSTARIMSSATMRCSSSSLLA